MKVIKFPSREEWPEIVRRPAMDTRKLSQAVSAIVEDVRTDGDVALRRYSLDLDGVDLETFLVTEEEFREADLAVSSELKEALDIAKANIEKFHTRTADEIERMETMPGLYVGSVGCLSKRSAYTFLPVQLRCSRPF